MVTSSVVFALATTGYILVAVRLEERDLIEHFGDVYRGYRERVPAFFPRPGQAWKLDATGPAPKAASNPASGAVRGRSRPSGVRG